MQIGIDFSRGPTVERTGTEEYAYRLVKALSLITSPADTFFLYVRSKAEPSFSLPAHFVWCPLGKPGQKFWTERALARRLKTHPVGALLVPAHIIPSVHPAHSVVMIHGLEFAKVPRAYSLPERLQLQLATALNLRRAAQVLVPSESTRADLENLHPAFSSKLVVVPHGVEASSTRKISHSGFNILFIGRLEKRKNLLRVVGAFEKFLQMRRAAGDTTVFRLILAGRDGFGAATIHRRIAASPVKTQIQTPGFVNSTTKLQLFATADLFFFPSLYEGFGLPVLEAFAAGVPVITSNLASLGEVAASAALKVDPQNETEMAGALDELYNARSLRANMIEWGHARALEFSWEACARATLSVLKS